MMCTIVAIPEWNVYATATKRERSLTLWSAQTLQPVSTAALPWPMVVPEIPKKDVLDPSDHTSFPLQQPTSSALHIRGPRRPRNDGNADVRIEYGPKGLLYVVTSDDKVVHKYDRQLRLLDTMRTEAINSTVFYWANPLGMNRAAHYIVVGDTTGSVTLYDRKHEAAEKVVGHTEKVTGAKVFKDFGLCTVALDSKVSPRRGARLIRPIRMPRD